MGYTPARMRVSHPSKIWYLIALLLLGLAVLFGFITVFIPWAQKDIGPLQRAYVAPFKTCIANTASTVNLQTCLDNDFISADGAPITGGSRTCRGFLQATVAWVFISVIVGVLVLVFMAFFLTQLYSRPILLAILISILLFFEFGAFVVPWAIFIAYSQNTCAPPPSVVPFPVGSYSYGFIMYIFASVFAFLAFLASLLGLLKMMKFRPDFPWEEGNPNAMAPTQDFTAYPMPAYPMEYSLSTPSMSPMYFDPQPAGFSGW